LTYAEFIDEIRRLAAEAEALIRDTKSHHYDHESRAFRDWRYAVENTVMNATDNIGFNLPGTFASRNRLYRAAWQGAAPNENRAAFGRDMLDTLRELQFFVEQFDKFGVPKALILARPAKAALDAPEKVTARWLLDNVPIGVWAAGAGILLAAFLVGVTAAQFPLVRALIESFKR
jgi:hypothetical protein